MTEEKQIKVEALKIAIMIAGPLDSARLAAYLKENPIRAIEVYKALAQTVEGYISQTPPAQNLT